MMEDIQEQRPVDAKPDFLAWVKGLKERAETTHEPSETRVWTPIGERPPL